MRVLIVDDDPDFLDALQMWFHLTWEGWSIDTAAGGREALDALGRDPDLILLDLNLPDMDGYELCSTIRRTRRTPIVVLTCRTSEVDMVRGLEAGADDYVRKPFSSMELQARLRAVLRRSTLHEPMTGIPPYAFHDLTVDFTTRQVKFDQEVLRLTPIEYGILCHLIRHAPGVLTHESLLQEVWGVEYRSEREYVRVHVRHLRQKLRDDAERPRFIATEHGLGYRFLGPPLHAAARIPV